MVTLLGIIVIPLGAYWFCRLNTLKLLYLFAAVTPFSAGTIVEFKGSLFGMVPSFFVASLLVAAFLIRNLLGKSRLRTGGMTKYYYLSFSLMWLYSLLSLLLPVVFVLAGSDYSLFNPAFTDKNYGGEVPVYTITQFVYFTLFLVSGFVVMNETVDKGVAMKCLRILLYVTIFSMVWGLIFYGLGYLGVKYPDWAFNNHPGYYQGFEQRFAILRRISSIAQEPSVYGYFLTIMIAMTMTFNVLELYLLKPSVQKILPFLMVLTALLTTSTTAFIGIFVATVMTVVAAGLCGRVRFALGYLTKQIALLVMLAAAAVLTVVSQLEFDADALLTALYELTFQKSQTESGLERAWSFFHGIEVLVSTGFLGSGFASNRTFDLGSTLLANTGILGFTLFALSFLVVIVWSMYCMRKFRCSNDETKLVAGLVSGLITALALMFSSIPDFVNMYFWLILGLLMALSRGMRVAPAAGQGERA